MAEESSSKASEANYPSQYQRLQTWQETDFRFTGRQLYLRFS
jgi:hypothetical protein